MSKMPDRDVDLLPELVREDGVYKLEPASSGVPGSWKHSIIENTEPLTNGDHSYKDSQLQNLHGCHSVNGDAPILNGKGADPEQSKFHHQGDNGWSQVIERITDRCDLSPLAKDTWSYRIASHDDDYKVQREKTATLVVNGRLHRSLLDISAKHDVPISSFVLFSLHKMLHVFGNGRETVIAYASSITCTESSTLECVRVIPVIVQHHAQQSASCIKQIMDIESSVSITSLTYGDIDLHRFPHGSLDCLFTWSSHEATEHHSRFPLTFTGTTNGSGLTLMASFDGKHFDDVVIDRFLSVVHVLLLEISNNAEKPTEELEFLSNEQRLLFDEWNRTEGDYPDSKRLHHLVEEAVERTPDKVAIVYQDVELTYRDLNQRANQLAHYLRSTVGVHPEQFIALLLDKNELMIITVLGIWKSGAAYIPIDPMYPDERLRFTLDDTQAQIVIAGQRHAHRLENQIAPSSVFKIIQIEPLLASLHVDLSIRRDNLNLSLHSRQLAYVTYTSGTTGIPKGIYKEHRSVVNSITDLAERYEVRKEREVVLLFSAYVFEPFVRQTLMALINSQLLAIIDDTEKLDPLKLTAFVKRHGVTYLNGTASVIQEFDFSECPSLRRLLLVGEDLTETRYKELRRRFKHRIINEYGFTESAFVTAVKMFYPNSQRLNRSLGKPLRNVKWYIMSNSLKQMPIGAIGELHIGGLGVSKGYLNRPELTKQRFITNPFQTGHEKRNGTNGLLYKTGDLARWLPDGEVEYLGRNDFQIKLRGLRIEPGEIESVLSLYPGVRSSLVVARELKGGKHATGSKHLFGYYVSDGGRIPETDLLAFLEKKLPRYMIPTRITQMERIPVTVNGKVNLRALPEVDLSQRDSVPVGLRNDRDDQLGRIWSEILGISLETISLEDNFFRCGGHSITCIQLISRIRQVFSLHISVEDVFSTRTMRNLSDLLWKVSQAATREEPLNPKPRSTLQLPSSQKGKDIDAFFVANSLQQGFVYHYLKQGASNDAYVMQTMHNYRTSICHDRLKIAWIHAQRRYSSIRMRLHWEEDVLQIIDRDPPLDWRFVDLTDAKDELEQQLKIVELQKQDKMEPYHLEDSKLFRVYLIRLSDDHFNCLFSCHHAILDGWSLPILFQYVHQTYLHLVGGEPIVCKPDKAYLEAQAFLQAHRHNHIGYWRHHIKKIVERCDLNALLNERVRYNVLLSDYDTVQDQKEKTLALSGVWKTGLREVCSIHGITLHSILQFVWHSVLHTYGGGCQTVVGTIIAGRNLPIDDIESSVGLFINTLPLIVDHTEEEHKTVLAAVTDIQHQVNIMNSRSHVELSHILDGKLKHGLFDTLFVLENYPTLDKSRENIHRQLLQFDTVNEIEKLDYPLAVIARESQACDGFTFTICYAGELFEDTIIDELLYMVQQLFTQIADNPEKLVKDLQYLGPSQLSRLARWNANESLYPAEFTLHQLFEREVARVPEKTAVIYEDVKLNYRIMNEQANMMGHYLRSCIPIKSNDIIALFMDKSERMMVSIFAVWKSGAAYTPIDPSYPEGRVQYILKDTAAKIVITEKCYASRLRKMTGDGMHIIESDSIEWYSDKASTRNIQLNMSSSDLAYIIYTSGTTGTPKGVMIEHRGVVNLQVSLSRLFSLRELEDEVILTFSNYVFDHFVEVFTDALLNGQALLVLNDEMRSDKERLYKYISDNQVTYLSGTPSVISVYEYDRFDHIRRIDCIGEAFTEGAFRKIRETYNGLIINGYGPTEVSITSHKRLYPPDQWRKDHSIGKQVTNTTSYVLDENMKLVPIGAAGELYIGGVGVARGYHNRPDLTAKNFPVNPFQSAEEKESDKNSRIYKTGDLVRWLPHSDGEIEYLGRNDSQVKIRGIRIELGEIETVLSGYHGITRAVVVVKEQPRTKEDIRNTSLKFLVGYFVSNTALLEHDIHNHIRERLPDYMVPNRLVRIERIPVTISGKVDARELPLVDFSTNVEYLAPRNDVETTLCAIWSDVLGISSEKIGIHDDFFSLGGDSLLSTKLSFTISKAFERLVTIAALFKYRTIETMSQFILSKADESSPILPLRDSGKATPVSLAQERVLFIDEFEGGTDAYNIVMNFDLPMTTDRKLLQKSFRSVLSRHQALRSFLPRQKMDGARVQHILDEEEAQSIFTMHEIAVSDLHELHRLLLKESQYVFRLAEELPFRISFYEDASNKELFYMSIVLHHVCFDAWSWTIFERDLKAFYRFYKEAQGTLDLPILHLQYRDVASWQRSCLTGDRREKLASFWRRKLNGFEQLQLIPDFHRPPHFDYKGRDVQFRLDPKLTSGLRRLARDINISLYSLLASAYCLMLGVYTNQRDIVIGVPVANRTRREFEDIIGFFVNMIVLRIDIDGDSSAVDYILRVSQEFIQGQLHQDMPFQEVVKELQTDNDPSRHPLVQAVFNYEAMQSRSQDSSNCRFSDLTLTEHQWEKMYTTAKFDLAATIIERGTGLHCNFNCAASVFADDSIRGFISLYCRILWQFSKLHANTPRSIKELSMADEASGLICATDDSISDLSLSSQAKTLHEAFEREARVSSSAIAVVSQRTRISYQELNERTNQLAWYLWSMASISSDDVIALILDKSELTIISILAVWKAGAAYVPIDPKYPKERIRFILEDTGAKIVVANQKYRQRVESFLVSSVAVYIDSLSTIVRVNQLPTSELMSGTEENNLAYVIYTSGTTGNPKGVLVEHKGVLGLRNSLRTLYFGSDIGTQHGILFLSNYVFDFSVEQLVLSILSSNKLIIPDRDFDIDDQFYNYVNENELTYLSGTPTFLHQIDMSRLEHLKVLTAAGEAFHANQFEKIRNGFNGTVHNAYGITETTVYNMVARFEGDSKFRNTLGQLLPGMRGYLLNDCLQMLPLGAVGELYLAGGCVARGYLNQPELTKERFLANPFRTEEDIRAGRYHRMYKTGDLVRRLPGGQLEYLGRNDLQVKLRGFRLELGEIAAVFGSYPGIKESTVVAKYDEKLLPHSRQAKYLVGYYVTDDPQVTELKVSTFMKHRLPAHMVPVMLIRLNTSLPVTINGKLDTRALPDSHFHSDKHKYFAPRNDRERNMSRIWSRILGIDDLGINDNFFQLGGDSILSLQLTALIREELNLKVTAKDVFDCKSIRDLCDNISVDEDQPSRQKDYVTEQGSLAGKLPLLPIQEWFFSKNLKNCHHWNQTFTIQTPQLDVKRLKSAVEALQDHHDAFKLRFKYTRRGYIQYYDYDQREVDLNTMDIGIVALKEEQDATFTSWQSGFDVRKGPMFAVGYIHGFNDGSARVWFAIHHLIVDTVSWSILIRDLEAIYKYKKQEKKGSSYRQWTLRVDNYLHTGVEQKYWHSVVKDTKWINQRWPMSGKTTNRAEFSLTIDQTRHLLRECNALYETRVNELLLTAVGYALQEITKTQTTFVTLEGHGREPFDTSLNVSRTMGWFTTMYPFALSVVEDLGLTISSIRKSLREVPNNGIGYGATFGYVQKPLPRVTFNYLGQFEHHTTTSDSWNLTNATGTMSLSIDPSDEDANDAILDITGMCLARQMNFTISSRFESSLNVKLCSLLKMNLERIISHTLLHRHSTTPMDNPGFINSSLEEFVPYFELRHASNTSPVLFLLPPGEGGAESYFNNISKHLSATYSLIIFNNYYLHFKIPSTFEELARIYICYIRQVQPIGPYHFFGWSFGGVLAFEIVRQLGHAGEHVATLAILDSYFGVGKASADLGLPNEKSILDPINYVYTPGPSTAAEPRGLIPGADTTIILFKAPLMNDTYRNEHQRKLYEYYMRSEYNNLDLLVSRERIAIVLLNEETHFSWLRNEKQVVEICQVLRNSLGGR